MIWHYENKNAILNEFEIDENIGLTNDRIPSLEKTYEKNILREKKRVPFLKKFFMQFKDAMVIILLIAALLSVGINLYNYYQGNLEKADWVDPIVIMIIVIVNAFVGAIQEHRAESAIEALKSLSSPKAKVTRNGERIVIPTIDLYPGDIVHLEAGDLVPADIRILQCFALKIDESSLTGESIPVEKSNEDSLDLITPLAERSNMAYSGCMVTNGTAIGIVVETGMKTEIGKIATILETETKDITPLQKRLDELGKRLGFLALAICFVIFIIGLLAKMNWLDILLTSISLAVAAIPEGLPAVVTVVLAIGVQKMAKKNAIVRRLSAVETLGCASIICTDKTGTLTQNKMTLERCFVDGKIFYLDDVPNRSIISLIQMSSLCTDGEYYVEGKDVVEIGDPTETAILNYAFHHRMDKRLLMEEYPRIGEIPFDSDRKRMSSIHLMNNRKIVIVKGAPDQILPLCNNANTEQILKANQMMAKDALRILAVAYKFIEDTPTHLNPETIETNLTFAGLLGMIDPPRQEAINAIQQCKTAGIQTIMITGDHPITAAAIGKKLGIISEDAETITGAELATMSDDDLYMNIHRFHVYARVSPNDKLRIVKAWQRAGKIVSMTGDGVNDAPALQVADIGCAMGITGSDVAINVADMVLTDDNFATIVSAVKRGRGIYSNIRKAIQYLLSCNIGEILLILATLIIWKQPALLPVQLLWINLVTDSFPALALGMDPPDYDIMRSKPRGKHESLFANGLATNSIWQGAMIAALSIIAFAIGHGVNDAVAQTMAFAVLAFSQLIHSMNVRSNHSILRIHFYTNIFLILAIILSAGLMSITLFIPFMEKVFGTVALNGKQWTSVIFLSIAPLIIVEIYKMVRNLIQFITKHFGS
ncbi:MAG: calcium-translocating P-type ATPase, PMCA-type [Clostridia bacterium]|nr:calcium-translocating P-type ATPase, PMCA-type [Clostridia bacterium]